MKNTNLIIIVLLILFVGAGGFFAGVKYQQSKQPTRPDFQSLREMRQSGGMLAAPQRAGSEVVRGEIIDQDKESITVKLADNSSKIILISENTTINKTTEGSVDDLETGKQIVVFGQGNSDKSISATNIQLDFGFREGMRGN